MSRATEHRPSNPESGATPTLGPRLMSVQQIATETGMSVWTVRDLIAGGALRRVELPNVRRVLVDRRDLERALESWKR